MPRCTVSLIKKIIHAATVLPFSSSLLYSATFRNGFRFVKHRKKAHDLNEPNTLFTNNPVPDESSHHPSAHQHHQKKGGASATQPTKGVVINSKKFPPCVPTFPLSSLIISPIDTPSVGCVYFSREIIGLLSSPHGWVCPARPSSQESATMGNACCACEFFVERGVESKFPLVTPAGRRSHCVPVVVRIIFAIPSISASETYTSFWPSVSVRRDCHPPPQACLSLSVPI